MRLFGYPYNNDLVICKDSPDYLTQSYLLFSVKRRNVARQVSTFAHEVIVQEQCRTVDVCHIMD